MSARGLLHARRRAPRRMQRPRGMRTGFTILEVVLALAILLLGLTSVLGLLSFGAAMARTAALRTTSSQAVDAVLADLEENLFPLQPDGSAGEPVKIEERKLPADEQIIYSAVATPRPDQLDGPAAPLEYRVDVELSWTSSGVRRQSHFQTLMLREVPFSQRLRLGQRANR